METGGPTSPPPRAGNRTPGLSAGSTVGCDERFALIRGWTQRWQSACIREMHISACGVIPGTPLAGSNRGPVGGELGRDSEGRGGGESGSLRSPGRSLRCPYTEPIRQCH
ncbi:hypothetical protein AAFF_G00396240 [Aldrovandia affinis]|uniref:Uncharacterized protein n=1 Tax=Aldrovandia affinis TaxID=143900 RepID=A0AAD7WKY1_9TELE|nr:hypothetical protein AAFF_G00396240 [Aldrovandia affinis]